MHVSSRDSPQSLEFWEDGRQSGQNPFLGTTSGLPVTRPATREDVQNTCESVSMSGYGDLAPLESGNQPEGPRESQQGYPGVFTDHELCSATPPIQNTGND